MSTEGPGAENERLRRQVQRERSARREAEAIAERATRELYDRQRELVLLEAVARSANEAEGIADAVHVALEAVCAHVGWPLGHAFLLAPGTDRLDPLGVWRLPREGAARFAAFCAASETRSFGAGEGLPGGVLATRKAMWVTDVQTWAPFARAEAAEAAGLHSALAFPLRIADQVVGVLELYSERATERDEAVLELCDAVGTTLGRVVERVRAAGVLEQRNDELQSSNAELERFAYVASHDLSEPLRSLSGFSQLLARRYRGRLDEDADAYLGHLVDGAARLQQLIDDLLTYSRSSTQPLRSERVALDAVAGDAVRALAAAVEERDAQVSVAELPTVAGDAGQIARVFQNLLANAIKFVPAERTPHIAITARTARDGWVELAIADNGIGVDPAHAERVFGMFARLHDRGRHPGTGIGLAVCQRVIERHGGRIWVEPADGGGSVFRFTLPAG